MEKRTRGPSWLIPLLVFPSITALSAYLIRNGLFVSGLGHDTGSQCNPGTPAYKMYGRFCVSAMAFLAPVEGLLGFASTYFNYFNVAFTPLYLMIQVEASRMHVPRVLSLPLITGILLLLFTAGPIIPLYCLAFVLTGAASAQNSDNATTAFAINRNHAEAIAFAVVVGYVIPTIGLAAFMDLPTLLIWFGFHPWMSLLKAVWRGARADTSQVDIAIVKRLYAITFVVTSIAHICAVLERRHDLEVLRSFFLPPLSNLQPKATVSPTWVMELFQWDALLSIVAVMMATLWFAKDAKELSRLLIWHVTATMTVGPSASICGAFLWRETCLARKITSS
ncbi:hypothetical protein JB92DRAFT_2958609 [Gautieria morchelliformis]|nr:hypothetical protein JB92DRAFT_2958609 [Gautieria morchelliformis]